MSTIDCQSFREGCVGCCVNPRWSDTRLHTFLARNTDALAGWDATEGHPRRADIVRAHWRRGGVWDHLLMLWLLLPTLGLSLLIWRRWFGGCVFAGFLSTTPTRVGCLIHPARWGQARGGQECTDLRRWAFPWVPTLYCNRRFECPGLHAPTPQLGCDYATATAHNAATCRQRMGHARRAGSHDLPEKKDAKKKMKKCGQIT